MISEILKQQEPSVYLALQNDLKSRRLAHCYLLSGQLNPLKLKTAFLLAQSIIEDKGDFACELCDTCKRIQQNAYFDLIYIDGYASLITKGQVEGLMERFSQTSLEKAGKKVYIISNINNSTDKVLNMLLKFSEEPSSQDTYGIFLSDDTDSLLETIVSRCKKIEFKTRDFSWLVDEYRKQGYDELDSYLLAHLYHSFVESRDDQAYLIARDVAFSFVDHLKDPYSLPILFAEEFFPQLEKEEQNRSADLLLEILSKMLQDALEGSPSVEESYEKALNILKKDDLISLSEILANGKKLAVPSLNRSLLFDHMAQQIISYKKEYLCQKN